IVRRLADEITAGLDSPRARAEAIYYWVSRNIAAIDKPLGLEGPTPRGADTILGTYYGDSEDHVVALVALLSAAGIKASPVLLNGARTFWLPDVPLIVGLFDRVIAY